MKKKTFIVSLIVVLVLILSFGLSFAFSYNLFSCNNKEQEHKHKFENNVCTDCSELRDVSEIAQTDFKNVGDKYYTVVKPIYDVVWTIWQDIVNEPDFGKNYLVVGVEDDYVVNYKDILTDETRNVRITGIRYTNDEKFSILVNLELYVLEADDFNTENGDKSQFLQLELAITLKDFGDNHSKTLNAFSDFLDAESKLQSSEKYVEEVLPYAKRSAELILAQYEIYKSSDKKDIDIVNYGKKIILSADSSLSEVYEKIVENLNGALEKRGYPLITGQDLNISLGDDILIETNINNLVYAFYLEDYNEDEKFTEEYLLHIQGKTSWAWATYPDWFNPDSKEYSEIFENLKIEEHDLSNLGGSGDVGKYSAFLFLILGNGYLYFQ